MTNNSDSIDSFLDDDIPVVDSSGARHLVSGAGVVNDDSRPAKAASSAVDDSGGGEAGGTAPADDLALGANGVPDEVKAVAKSEKFKEMLKGADAMEVVWDRMADESVSQLHLDEEMTKRFRKMVELYFRDLRDTLETVSKMTMPIASGGMGMNDEQAEEVMSLLKKKNDDLQARLSSQTAEEKETYLAKLAVESMENAASEAKADKEELDQIYSRVTNRADAPAPPPEPQPSEPRRIPVVNHDEPVETDVQQAAGGDDVLGKVDFMDDLKKEEADKAVTQEAGDAIKPDAREIKTEPVVAPPPNLPIERDEGVADAPEPEKAADEIPPAPAPVAQEPPAPAVKTEMPAELQDSRLAEPAVPAAPVAKPEEPEMPSPSSAPVTIVSSDKPRVSDVTPTPRLTGPVEELGQFNLADFRRLSKDPKEACLKVMDKIDILGEQSFEIKNRGVKAWQDSPVNRLYLDILRESLEGKPVSGIIEARDKEGKGTLHKNEFDALMDLNRKLRFG